MRPAHVIFCSISLIVVACASLGERDPELPPALENRTLKISSKVTGFEYQWRECTKRGLFGRCQKIEMRTELYDLSDAAVREKLINMGFVARVRDKVLP